MSSRIVHGLSETIQPRRSTRGRPPGKAIPLPAELGNGLYDLDHTLVMALAIDLCQNAWVSWMSGECVGDQWTPGPFAAVIESANRVKRSLGASGDLSPDGCFSRQGPPSWPQYRESFVSYCPHVNLTTERPTLARCIRQIAEAAVILSGGALHRMPVESPMVLNGLHALARGADGLWNWHFNNPNILATGRPLLRDDGAAILDRFREGLFRKPMPTLSELAELSEGMGRMKVDSTGYYAMIATNETTV